MVNEQPSPSKADPKTYSPTDLKRLHRQWRRDTDLRLSLILDGVQNPYNVGSLLRSAAAYNVETVWAVAPTPGIDHPGVAKTALGTGRLITFDELDDGPTAVSKAREAGYTVVAVELADGAVPMFSVNLGPAVCLVLGHEDRGVRRDTLATVDHICFLPQLGKVGSLNVAQAGTVALYEATRQAAMAQP